ncbi:uncharacterized protein [Panulirus ornatus]|uniref:uncharacterized protein isoform X1 n=1 Tax=Panulirus ornatus TaxID=150431 RepID=UPI003A8C575D
MASVSGGGPHPFCALKGALPSLLWLATGLSLLQGGAGSAISPRVRTLTITDSSANDIEEFVKKLEYEAVNGVDNAVDGLVVPVDLNLLPDASIADDIEEGLQEDFTAVDKELGENTTQAGNATAGGPQSRHLSLIYKGVYGPDARFNAFVDGVMVNMVAEIKRKRMDPLYFRVYDRGIVEHVSTRAGRNGQQNDTKPASPAFNESTPAREGRQRGSAIGGGVIRGLTNIRRFGNAEVQIAGNTTLVRSHYVYGPLNIELVFHTDMGVKTINSTLTAVAAHAVAEADGNSSRLIDFIIDSPLFEYMAYYGNRTLSQQRTTEFVVQHLFSNASFMTLLLRDAFEVASYDKIIPQFGTEANYYSVLKYLFAGDPEALGRSQPSKPKGISLAGGASDVAAYLKNVP